MEFSVVVGLGNPGSQYDATRHNVGFAVVDLLRALSGLSDPGDLRSEAGAHVRAAIGGSIGRQGWVERTGVLESQCSVGNWSGHLIKPMTYMNRSGEPLQQFLHYRKIPLSQVVVVHDEIDIPFGSLRIKVDGGEGGHNGLRSISESCGGRGYARVRVGVGKPPPGSPMALREDGIANWVLSRFSAEEQPFAEDLVINGARAVYELVSKGVRAAQNLCNR
ncbi:MAG: aminoacyl-tRNA hydrolase [Pseudomonadota bacterium]|jgi:PTH1 family peptidyl-tRNA hydrolase